MKKYDLDARFDKRKSFYGKAKTEVLSDGTINLYSYGVLVSQIKNGILTHLGKWSMTTSRHQREFEKQYEAGEEFTY